MPFKEWTWDMQKRITASACEQRAGQRGSEGRLGGCLPWSRGSLTHFPELDGGSTLLGKQPGWGGQASCRRCSLPSPAASSSLPCVLNPRGGGSPRQWAGDSCTHIVVTSYPALPVALFFASGWVSSFWRGWNQEAQTPKEPGVGNHVAQPLTP